MIPQKKIYVENVFAEFRIPGREIPAYTWRVLYFKSVGVGIVGVCLDENKEVVTAEDYRDGYEITYCGK